MNTEEEFYLGNNSEDAEFFLGNLSEEFYLGDTPSANSETDSDDDKSYQELLEIYELLKIDAKPYKVEFEEFFKDNPEIFKVADAEYFKTLSDSETILPSIFTKLFSKSICSLKLNISTLILSTSKLISLYG